MERERDVAEASRDRFSFLAEVSRCLADSLDSEATLTTVAGTSLQERMRAGRTGFRAAAGRGDRSPAVHVRYGAGALRIAALIAASPRR